MSRIVRVGSYVAGFGLARGAMFAAPLLAANLLPLAAYGTLEIAQAVAALLALVLGLGLQGSVPLVLLRDEVSARWDTLLWMLICLAVAAGVMALLARALWRDGFSVYVLVPLGVTVLVLQGLWAIWLKSQERGTGAVFLEAGFWIAALLGACAVAFLEAPLWAITAALVAYAAVLLSVTLHMYAAARAPFAASDLAENIRVGLPLMLTSSLTLLVSAAGRLVLGAISGIEAVGFYAILFRATTVPLVGHQLLIIAFFRRLFVWEAETLTRRVPVIILGVSACVAGFWLLEPLLGWMLGPAFAKAFSQYAFTGHLILLQTILWSAIALNDLLTSRLQIAGRVAMATGPTLLGSLAIITWIVKNSEAPLERFVMLHAVAMVLFYVVQSGAILALGHAFWRLWLLSLGTFGLGIIVLFSIY